MKLNKELKKLNNLKSVDTEKFEALYLSIREKFTLPEEIQLIDNYIIDMLSKSGKKIDAFIEEATHNFVFQDTSKEIGSTENFATRSSLSC